MTLLMRVETQLAHKTRNIQAEADIRGYPCKNFGNVVGAKDAAVGRGPRLNETLAIP